MENGIIPVEKWSSLAASFKQGEMPMPFVKDIFLISCHVAGTSYADATGEKTRSLVPGSNLTLKREPANHFDPLAILVLNAAGEKIGYLPRAKNEIAAHLMDGGKLLFGQVESINRSDDWIHIEIKVFMRDL